MASTLSRRSHRSTTAGCGSACWAKSPMSQRRPATTAPCARGRGTRRRPTTQCSSIRGPSAVPACRSCGISWSGPCWMMTARRPLRGDARWKPGSLLGSPCRHSGWIGLRCTARSTANSPGLWPGAEHALPALHRSGRVVWCVAGAGVHLRHLALQTRAGGAGQAFLVAVAPAVAGSRAAGRRLVRGSTGRRHRSARRDLPSSARFPEPGDRRRLRRPGGGGAPQGPLGEMGWKGA